MTVLSLRHVVGCLLAASLLPLSACSGGDDGGTPEEALEKARGALEETSGVRLTLRAEELPEGVDGVLEAEGVATRAPAFDGDLTVMVNSLTLDVPVISVNGEVFAKLPFTTEFAEIEPADYGAPDPAALMDPAEGIASWLADVEGLKAGERVREGDTVLATYAGTLPGATIDAAIPSADEAADFPVTFRIDEDGRLRTVEVSGPFYGEGGVVDYTLGVNDYGTERDIDKP